MDPVTLATVTSAVTLLATESAKGLAGQAGKDLWSRIRSILGWSTDPEPKALAPAVAERLAQDEEAARQIVELLQTQTGTVGAAAAIVGNVNAQRLIVITGQQVTGGFTINMGDG